MNWIQLSYDVVLLWTQLWCSLYPDNLSKFQLSERHFTTQLATLQKHQNDFQYHYPSSDWTTGNYCKSSGQVIYTECTINLSKIMKVLKKENKSCHKTIWISLSLTHAHAHAHAHAHTHTHTHTHTQNSGHTTTILHTEPTTTLYSTELLTGYTNSLVCNTNFPNEKRDIWR
jgi:hypothetical protein